VLGLGLTYKVPVPMAAMLEIPVIPVATLQAPNWPTICSQPPTMAPMSH